jgi:hypothetical protein
MSTRNRSSYTNQAGRRTGGGTVRQAGAILFMGALSFVLGFFVLARIMPMGRGPDSPTGPLPSGDSNDSSRSEQATVPPVSRERNVASTPRPSVSAARVPLTRVPGPSIDPTPSIDPADEGETQKPTSIDDPSNENKPDENRSDENKDKKKDENKDQQKSVDAEKQAANAGNSHLVEAQNGGNETSADTPAPRRRRRRSARSTPPGTTADNNMDKKPADDTTTQRPHSLDDSGDGKGDN